MAEQLDITESIKRRALEGFSFADEESEELTSPIDFQSTLDGSKIEPQVFDYNDGFLDALGQLNLVKKEAVTRIKNSGGIPNLKTSWNENHEKLIKKFSLQTKQPHLFNQLTDSLTRNDLNEYIISDPYIKDIIENDDSVGSKFEEFKKRHSRFRRTTDPEEKQERLMSIVNDLTKFQQNVLKAKQQRPLSFYRSMAVKEYLKNNPEMEGKVTVEGSKILSPLTGKERGRLNEELEGLTEEYKQNSELATKNFVEKSRKLLEGNVSQEREMAQLKGEEDIANEEALEGPKAFDQSYTYVIAPDGEDVYIVPRDLGTASKDLWLGKAYQEVKFAGEGTFSPTLFESYIGKNEVIHLDGRKFRLKKWITPIDLNGETVVPDMYYFDEIPEYGNINGGGTGVYMQSLAADMIPPMAMNAATAPLLGGGPLGWIGYVLANTGTGFASNSLAQDIRIQTGVQREFNQWERAASAILSNFAFLKAPQNFLRNANNLSKFKKDLIFNATNSAIQGGIANSMYQYGEMTAPDSDIYGTNKYRLDQLGFSMVLGGTLGSGFTILGQLMKKPDDVARFVQERRILNQFEERLPALDKELNAARIAAQNDPENSQLQKKYLEVKTDYDEFKTQLKGLRSSNSQYIADLIDETKKLDDFEAPDFVRSFQESTGNVDLDIQGYLLDYKKLENEYAVNQSVFDALNEYIEGKAGAKVGDSGIAEFAKLDTKRKAYVTAIRDKAEKTLKKREEELGVLNKEFNENLDAWKKAGAELNAPPKDSVASDGSWQISENPTRRKPYTKASKAGKRDRSKRLLDVLFHERNEDKSIEELVDLNSLKKLSGGGSGRQGYEIPYTNLVIKVAKNAKGLEQNDSLQYGDFDILDGATSKLYAKGANFIVVEKAERRDGAINKLLKPIKDHVSQLSRLRDASEQYQYIYNNEKLRKAFEELLGEDNWSNLFNYEGVLWGDFVRPSSWGFRGKRPIIIDEGVLNSRVHAASEPDPQYLDDFKNLKKPKQRTPS